MGDDKCNSNHQVKFAPCIVPGVSKRVQSCINVRAVRIDMDSLSAAVSIHRLTCWNSQLQCAPYPALLAKPPVHALRCTRWHIRVCICAHRCAPTAGLLEVKASSPLFLLLFWKVDKSKDFYTASELAFEVLLGQKVPFCNRRWWKQLQIKWVVQAWLFQTFRWFHVDKETTSHF